MFGFYRPNLNPLDELAGSKFQDQVILAQAAKYASTAASGLDIVEQMRIAIKAIDGMSASAKPFGLDAYFGPLRKRLDDRSKALAAKPDDPDTYKWGAQIAAQLQILFRSAAGLQWAANQRAAVGGEPPDYMAEPLTRVARAYAAAAASSEYAERGEQLVAKADTLTQEYPLAVLDGALASIRDANASNAEIEKEHGNAGANTERELRKQLNDLRAEILTDPKHAAQVLADLQKKVSQLHRRVSAIRTLSALDGVIGALENHISIVRNLPRERTHQVMESAAREKMLQHHKDTVAGLQPYRKQWAAIAELAYKGSEEDFEASLKEAANTQEDLRKKLESAVELAKATEDFDRIMGIVNAFILAFAIAIATWGVGEIVAGGALALGLSEGGTAFFLVTTGAEALTLTTLNAAAQGDWSHFGGDLLFNFVTAGVLKGITKGYNSVLGGAAKTLPGKLGLLLTTTLSAAGLAVIKANMDTRTATGKDLTEEQAAKIMRDNVIQGIALAITMHVAGNFLPDLRGLSRNVTLKIKAINTVRSQMRPIAARVQAKTAPVEEATKLIDRDTELVSAENEVLEELKTQKLTEPEEKAVDAARAESQESGELARSGKITAAAESTPTGDVIAPHGELSTYKAHYESLGYKVEEQLGGRSDGSQKPEGHSPCARRPARRRVLGYGEGVNLGPGAHGAADAGGRGAARSTGGKGQVSDDGRHSGQGPEVIHGTEYSKTLQGVLRRPGESRENARFAGGVVAPHAWRAPVRSPKDTWRFHSQGRGTAT